MKKLLISLVMLNLIGCASQHTHEAAPQNYRIKNTDKPISISGIVDVNEKSGVFTDSAEFDVTIKFEGQPQIIGKLDNALSGDFIGKDYNGQKTAATCNGKIVSQNAIEVRCIVFIDNEKTVTLTF